MRRVMSIVQPNKTRRTRHLRLIAHPSVSPNLDAARGILNGLMISGLLWFSPFPWHEIEFHESVLRTYQPLV